MEGNLLNGSIPAPSLRQYADLGYYEEIFMGVSLQELIPNYDEVRNPPVKEDVPPEESETSEEDSEEEITVEQESETEEPTKELDLRLFNRTMIRASKYVDNFTFNRIPNTDWETDDRVLSAVCAVAEVLQRRVDVITGEEKRVITQERLDTTYREYKATQDTNKPLLAVIKDTISLWLVDTGLMSMATPYFEGRWKRAGIPKKVVSTQP